MEPKIILHPETKLVGTEMTMSLSENKTAALWKNFMPNRGMVPGIKEFTPLYSLQVYSSGFFESFSPEKVFTKWAAVEVCGFSTVPAGMKAITIPAGLYAVFFYKGAVSEAATVFQYILGEWLPGSDYELDARPHFEKLGEKFNKDAADSEEEIWIPVRKKNSFNSTGLL